MQTTMIEQQVEIKVLTIDNHTFLTSHKAKAVAKFYDELFQVDYKTFLKVSFALHAFQTSKLQEVRTLEN